MHCSSSTRRLPLAWRPLKSHQNTFQLASSLCRLAQLLWINQSLFSSYFLWPHACMHTVSSLVSSHIYSTGRAILTLLICHPQLDSDSCSRSRAISSEWVSERERKRRQTINENCVQPQNTTNNKWNLSVAAFMRQPREGRHAKKKTNKFFTVDWCQ